MTTGGRCRGRSKGVAAMKLILLAIAICALASCKKEVTEAEKAILACEEWVKAGLRSPSTYRRAHARETNLGERSMVSLDYDAENGFGSPVRDSTVCVFKTRGDQVDTAGWYVNPDMPEETRDAAEDALASRVSMERLAVQLSDKPRELCCDPDYWKRVRGENSLVSSPKARD